MAGAAAGRDSRQHRHAQAAYAFVDRPSRFGVRRRFQLGLAARFQGQTAEAVGHQKDDFTLVVFAQFAHEVV